MEENKVLEEVKDLIPEVTTEITIEDGSTGGHPIVKAAIIGAVALGGAIGGYLFKRHRDRHWTKDFENDVDYELEEVEELDDEDSSEEKK